MLGLKIFPRLTEGNWDALRPTVGTSVDHVPGSNSQTSKANANVSTESSHAAPERIGPSVKRASSEIRHDTLPQSALLSGTRSRFFPVARPRIR